jgi:UDP-N-acetylmuramoylalanine--D-glutamate ligase
LIAGGKDKGNDYGAVRDLVEKHVKTIIAVGDGAGKVKSYFEKMTPVLEAGHSMEKAVQLAKSKAIKGDVVLLSPACASFDMFDNYEHRGKVFKDLVNAEN